MGHAATNISLDSGQQKCILLNPRPFSMRSRFLWNRNDRFLDINGQIRDPFSSLHAVDSIFSLEHDPSVTPWADPWTTSLATPLTDPWITSLTTHLTNPLVTP